MSSRDTILRKLRAAQVPFPDSANPTERLDVTPMADTSTVALKARFIEEAELLTTKVYQPATQAEAIDQLLTLLGDDTSVIAWDAAHLPLPTLPDVLAAKGITIADARDASVRVGISGADAALAVTGSLLVLSGAGMPRTASLLPPIHVALITDSHLLPNFEAWVAQQRTATLPAFRDRSNIVLITGPSRTSDIAMELTLGMHGPKELHIIFCPLVKAI